MTILAAYGFDIYDDQTEWWRDPGWSDTGTDSDCTPAFLTTSGRFGGGTFQCNPGASNCGNERAQLRLPGNEQPTTIFLSFSVHFNTFGSGTTFLWMMDGLFATHMHLRVDSGGTIKVFVLGVEQASFVTTINTWHRCEIKLIVDNATGKVIVKWNEQVELDFDGDTQVGANAFSNQFLFGSDDNGTAVVLHFDDVVVNDDQGSINNDFLGDLRIETVRPTADTPQIDFGSFGGGDNFIEVDESPGHDDDTTYVASATPGHRDLYTMADTSLDLTTIHGVVLRVTARKEDAGSRKIKLLANTSGTPNASVEIAVQTDYVPHTIIHNVDPDTAAAWTVEGINSLEVGAEVV